MTLDDLELPQGRILSDFRGISQIWEPTTAKRMKIDPYYQRLNCSPLSVLFSLDYVDITGRSSARRRQTKAG